MSAEQQTNAALTTTKEWNNSTQVASTSYQVASKVLTVTFRNGGVYEYYEVPIKTYVELDKTDSIGKFLNREIKGNYEFRKVA